MTQVQESTREGNRQLNVQVPASLYDALRRKAAKDGRSMSGQIRWLVEQDLERKATA